MTAYLVIAVLALYVISEYFNRRERAKLLNRLMARDYAQFNYYETKFKNDVKEVEAVREETREDRKEAKKEIEDEDNERLF